MFWTKLRVTISVKVSAEETASCNVETGSATVCCFTVVGVVSQPGLIILIVQNANSMDDSDVSEDDVVVVVFVSERGEGKALFELLWRQTLAENSIESKEAMAFGKE